PLFAATAPREHEPLRIDRLAEHIGKTESLRDLQGELDALHCDVRRSLTEVEAARRLRGDDREICFVALFWYLRLRKRRECVLHSLGRLVASHLVRVDLSKPDGDSRGGTRKPRSGMQSH